MNNGDIVNIESLFPVARIVKSYSTKGEVVIKITSPFFIENRGDIPLFILFDGLPVPFFIEKFVRRGNNGAVVGLSTVRDLEHAEELVNRELYVNPLNLPKKIQKEVAAVQMQNSIVGFKLYNQDNTEVGSISDYIEYPNNACIEVNGTLIPFNEELILDVDIENKTIKMRIPGGLL